MQVIQDNLDLEQLKDIGVPAERRAIFDALNRARLWMAAEWPRKYRFMPLAESWYLAEGHYLVGNQNNTAGNKKRSAGEADCLAQGGCLCAAARALKRCLRLVWSLCMS